MAKNNPVANWIPSTSPNNLPKFHHILKFTGDGKSTKVPLTIFSKGFLCRIRKFVT